MLTTSVAQTLFPHISFNDSRRDQRFATSLEAFAEHGGGTLPAIFPQRRDYDAFLRLIHSDSCTHENILSAHQIPVLDRLEQNSDTVLFLHDATVLDFSGHESLSDQLGPIGNGGGRGWMAYQTIAVDPRTQRIHGLVHQQLHVRPESTRGRSVAQRRKARDRETRCWLDCVRDIGPTPMGCHWVHVADRGADTFEFLQMLQDGKHHFIIRSSHNRALGEDASDRKAKTKLYDQLRSQPTQAQWEIETPGRRVKRTVLQAAGMHVTLRPPHVKVACYRAEPIRVNVVRVWEADPPKGVEGLEWFLLTSEPIEQPAQLRQVSDWYRMRWTSEEFHKTQKTGLGVEIDQIQDVKSLAALVLIRSVIAVWLFNGSRDLRDPEVSAEAVASRIPELWLKVMRVLLKGRGQLTTVGDFWIQLARLGGYMKRNPSKHPPGWQLLWRGWQSFQHALHYELSRAKM